jgi:hypothetical protein
MPYPRPENPDYCPGSEQVVSMGPWTVDNPPPRGPQCCPTCGRWIALKGSAVLRFHAHRRTENRSVMRTTAFARAMAQAPTRAEVETAAFVLRRGAAALEREGVRGAASALRRSARAAEWLFGDSADVARAALGWEETHRADPVPA